jgi:diaminohydroxyphosphoribosylaminopyrimidine deaminase/5-amino-6-(5-phosphoribosylamino)uracil reductase
LLQAECVDELLVYMAPVLLGEGLGMVRMASLQSLAQAQHFQFMDTACIAPDLRIRARHAERWKALLDSVTPVSS